MTEATRSPIRRRVIVEFVEKLGLDPHQIVEMRMQSNGIYVTELWRNEDGKRVMDEDEGGWIKERCFYPIINDGEKVVEK